MPTQPGLGATTIEPVLGVATTDARTLQSLRYPTREATTVRSLHPTAREQLPRSTAGEWPAQHEEDPAQPREISSII